MNDIFSPAKAAFYKENGLSLVEWCGLVALVFGFAVIGVATVKYLRPSPQTVFGCGSTYIQTCTS